MSKHSMRRELICAGLQSCVQSESQGSDDGIGGLNWMETEECRSLLFMYALV
jgi:hypothetical protein